VLTLIIAMMAGVAGQFVASSGFDILEPVSVIDAVTTWLPPLSTLVEKLAPDPMTPSRSDGSVRASGARR
jgi:hypothetical protein